MDDREPKKPLSNPNLRSTRWINPHTLNVFFFKYFTCTKIKRGIYFCLQVILGGGRTYMFPTTVEDPEYLNKTGVRKDGINLVDEWLKNKPVNSAFIKCAHQFLVWTCIVIFITELFFLKKQTFSTFVIVPHLQNAKYVWNKADFDAINPATTDFLMGKNSEVHHLQLRHTEKKNTRPWVL